MKALLCPPTYYDIEYEINPWMHLANKVDHIEATRQYESLKSLYQRLGIEVYQIEPQQGLPDMVYAANYGFVSGQTFIPSKFSVPQRQGEVPYAVEFFKSHGFEIQELPSGAIFEGQAELFKVADKYVFGWGKRSNRVAIHALAKLLGPSIVAVELVNPYYYHLDTAFAPLSSEAALINPDAFKKEDFEKIASLFTTVIATTQEDNKVMGCNLVVVGHNVVMGKGISLGTKGAVTRAGFEIHEVDTSEFLKGGGSIKCLTLEF